MRGMLMSMRVRPEIDVSTERRPTMANRSTPCAGALARRYRPLAPVTVRRSEPWTFTVTPGSGPPSGELTVPVTVTVVCACAAGLTNSASTRLIPAACRQRSTAFRNELVPRGTFFMVDLSVAVMSDFLLPGLFHGVRVLLLDQLLSVISLPGARAAPG